MSRIGDIPISKVPKWLIENASYDEGSLEELADEINKFLEKEFE